MQLWVLLQLPHSATTPDVCILSLPALVPGGTHFEWVAGAGCTHDVAIGGACCAVCQCPVHCTAGRTGVVACGFKPCVP